MRPARALASLALALLVALAAPLRAAEPPALPVKEIRLENGLRVFVLERSASPTFAGYYQFGVGGAMDPKGASGIAHLLEHMMFKGTTNVGTLDPVAEAPLQLEISDLWHELHAELAKGDDPFQNVDDARVGALRDRIAMLSERQKKYVVKNEFDEIMSRAGGVAENATTGQDVTNYFLALPANQLELWFYLESDRVLNPVFREFYSERDVVHEERRRNLENDAFSLSWEALMSLLFPASQYGTPVLGWPRDVDRLVEEDARDYFTTYYSPSNCTMVLVGDVKAAEVERLARKYFGPWRTQDLPPLHVTPELEQRGERRRVVEFDSEPSLMMAWPTGGEGSADEAALEILTSILGGLSSSRLDRTVVQRDRIAARAYSGLYTMRHAGMAYAGATHASGHSTPELEAAIAAEITRIQEHGVDADELGRAKIQVEAARVRSSKDNLGLAFRIGRAVGTSGGTEWIAESERRINAVTAAQVQDAARRYLIPSKRCVVEVVKTPGIGAPGESTDVHHHGGETGERGKLHSKGYGKAMSMIRSAPPVKLTIPEIGKDVARVELPCGTIVFLREDHSAPSVEMGFAWTGGSNTLPVEKLARMSLATQLLSEGGTESLDPMALSARMEELGMSFSIWMGGTGSGANLWSLSRNFDDAFQVALDVIQKPRFDGERLETIKGQFIDEQKRRYDYPGWGVSILENQVINGDHPRLGYEPTRAEIRAVTPADVREVWKRYLGNDNLRITVVGDFDAAAMKTRIEGAFCGWRKAEDSTRDWLAREPVVKPGAFLVEKEVSAPAISVVHQVKIDRTAPIEDHAALEILNDVLGGSGFRSRLMERLRSDEGLTYGIYSSFWHDARPGVPGSFSAAYETKKVSLARSIRTVEEEVAKMATGAVAQAEVAEQVDGWRNRFIFRFTSPFYSVQRLMSQEIDDRPYDWDQQLLAAIQKVTPADVERVARKYLKPSDLTISIFGMPTDEDRKALVQGHALRVLPKDEVFRGGYDQPEEVEVAPSPEPPPPPVAVAPAPPPPPTPAKAKAKEPPRRRRAGGIGR